MRRIKVFKWAPSGEKIDDGQGWFVEWGVDCTELRDGVGTYSAAIIERDDGTVETRYCGLIQFEVPTAGAG